MIASLETISLIWKNNKHYDGLTLMRMVLNYAVRLYHYHTDKNAILKEKSDASKFLGTGTGISSAAR